MLRATRPRREKNIEEKFKKLSQRDHILLRPEMYVGSVAPEYVDHWLFDPRAQGFILKSCRKFSAAFMKIFDEILVNATDNVLEHRNSSHPVTFINVTIKQDEFSVENDGPGIPVVKHKVEDLWIPDMVFGHFLTSKNFHNDATESAGRHGYGAKLTNVFSTKFQVNTVCKGKAYEQTWINNMAEMKGIEVTETQASDATKITFCPDYAKLGMAKKLNDEAVMVLKKRCHDIAVAFPDVQISFNGEKISSDFHQYLAAYAELPPTILAETAPEDVLADPDPAVVQAARDNFSSELKRYTFISPGVSVGVMFQPEGSKARVVSMVNGIVTYNGGAHQEHYHGKIKEACDAAADKVIRENKKEGMIFQRSALLNRLLIVIRVNVTQPKFDSQSKTRMVSEHDWATFDTDALSKFVGELPLFMSFFGSFFDAMALPQGNAARHVRYEVQKCHDAVLAGPIEDGEPLRCLCVVEGDSAASFIMSSMSAERRKLFGVLPLAGKLINVRGSTEKVAANANLKDLFSVMGLRVGHTPKSPNELRYQRIVITTDQDPDGMHIRGLVMNVMAYLWPELALTPDFLTFFQTPLLKFFPKSGGEVWFFTDQEKRKWLEENPNAEFRSPPRYYKGLGTSTKQEGVLYWANLDRHLLSVDMGSSEGMEELLSRTFNPERVKDRRRWIEEGKLDLAQSTISIPVDRSVSLSKAEMERLRAASAQSSTFPESPVKQQLENFVDNELRQFALFDNHRQIPCIIDGLKPTQRKILWIAMKHSDSRRVSQFAALVAEKTNYHHGESSMVQTCISLAQDFVGANNIPFLSAEGQFGSRWQRGHDHASPRYIFTKALPVLRAVFPAEDDFAFQMREEDESTYEPVRLFPIVPLVLVNGATGISVGNSCTIPPHHPQDVIDALTKLIDETPDDEEPKKQRIELRPGILGSFGSITKDTLDVKEAGFALLGACITHRVEDNTAFVRVIDIPYNKSIEWYRGALKELYKKKIILDFNDHSTGTTVDFEVRIRKNRWDEAKILGMHLDLLKLRSTLSPQVTLFDSEHRLREMDPVDHFEIFRQHFVARREVYKQRREKKLMKAEHAATIASGKARFAEDLKKERISGDLVANTAALKTYFSENKFPQVDGSYDYLLRLAVSSLDQQKATKDAETARELMEKIKATTISDMWKADLDVLSSHCAAREEAMRKEMRRELNDRARFDNQDIADADPENQKVKKKKSKKGGSGGGNLISNELDAIDLDALDLDVNAAAESLARKKRASKVKKMSMQTVAMLSVMQSAEAARMRMMPPTWLAYRFGSMSAAGKRMLFAPLRLRR